MANKLKEVRSRDLPAARAFTRREVLSRVVQTSVAGAAAIGLGAWLVGRDMRSEGVLGPIADHRVQRPPDALEMVIVRGPERRACECATRRLSAGVDVRADRCTQRAARVSRCRLHEQ